MTTADKEVLLCFPFREVPRSI